MRGATLPLWTCRAIREAWRIWDCLISIAFATPVDTHARRIPFVYVVRDSTAWQHGYHERSCDLKNLTDGVTMHHRGCPRLTDELTVFLSLFCSRFLSAFAPSIPASAARPTRSVPAKHADNKSSAATARRAVSDGTSKQRRWTIHVNKRLVRSWFNRIGLIHNFIPSRSIWTLSAIHYTD